MSITLNPAKAQKILTALKGLDKNYASLKDKEYLVYLNAYGNIIIVNGLNYEKIGSVINENRFQIGKLQFDF